MSIDDLFFLAFHLVTPFWALMIFAPNWKWTKKIIDSPWIIVGPLAIFFYLGLAIVPELLKVAWSPTVEGFTAIISSPEGATMIWAQIIAWDLAIGRWMYLMNRESYMRIHPLIMGPILFLASTLPAVVFPAFLVIRFVLRFIPRKDYDPASRDGSEKSTVSTS